MSKDADKDVVDPTGTPRARRRRKKSGLRIPSDNVPRTPSVQALSDGSGSDPYLDDTDNGIVAPVPEDPNVVVSVAYAFSAAHRQDEESRVGDTTFDEPVDAAEGGRGAERREARSGADDLETRKTTQMPAIRLEDLGLNELGGGHDDEDDDDVEIDIDEGEPEEADESDDDPAPRAATVALSDEDLEELIEPADSTVSTARQPAQRPFGRGGLHSTDDLAEVSVNGRVTQPIQVLSDALDPYVDDDVDEGLDIPSRRPGGTAPKKKSPSSAEPGVPAAVAALEDAGVESPHDSPLSFGDAGDSGEILGDELDELIEEVDESDVQMEADTPKSPPPTPPDAQPARKPPPAPRNKSSKAQAKPKRRKGKPWFEEIFDEDYLRTLPFLTPQATQAEAAFVSSALEVGPGAQILDIGCGYGRHAMELATRGYQVIALDLSLPLLLRGADEAQRRGLNINFVHGDMRELSFENQFDGAYCLFSTFGYFDDIVNKKTVEGIARALKPGGRLVIEVLNRDYLIADLPARVWWEGDGCVVLEEVDFNYFSSRIMSRRSVVFDDGRQLEQEISLRAYSLHEFGKLLHSSGFRVNEISGSMTTRGRFFGNQSRAIIVVASKREAGSQGDGIHQFPRGGTSTESSFP